MHPDSNVTTYSYVSGIDDAAPPQLQRYLVLAAVQFDATGDLALREAVDTARRNRNVELHVLHVLPPEPQAMASAAARLAAARMELRNCVDRVCRRGWLQVICHIRSGDAAETIVRKASELGADLIIVGTHHRIEMRRGPASSVAEHVLSEAQCPVLVAVPRGRVRADGSVSGPTGVLRADGAR